MAFPSDLEIARGASLKPLEDVAAEMGIGSHLLEPYGEQVMKVKLAAIEELADRPVAKYVVVSAITPTPLGEGKTTTTVGLGQGLHHIGRQATIAIRQPSMGPTFGIKGGAAGGGYSQVVPMEVLNLHLTGDMHAVTAAHNLLSAMIDNHLYQATRSASTSTTSPGGACSTSTTARCEISSSGSAGAATACHGRPVSTSLPRRRSWPRWR